MNKSTKQNYNNFEDDSVPPARIPRAAIQGPSSSHCACGAHIYNAHHCDNGHLQLRDQ